MYRRWFILALWLAVSLLASCGGSGPSGLEIRFTPSAPTVPTDSSVQITIQTSPPLNDLSSTLTWEVVGYQSHCTEGVLDALNAFPIEGCPNGYIAYNTGIGPDRGNTVIYYYAPSTTGSYQLSVSGKNFASSGNRLLNQGSATVNVTVTAQ
jgi:hypothetical protein